jgi:hypothetical protein
MFVDRVGDNANLHLHLKCGQVPTGFSDIKSLVVGFPTVNALPNYDYDGAGKNVVLRHVVTSVQAIIPILCDSTK